MMTKPSCILFAILILTWLSGGDAACTLPPSWTVVTDDDGCCTGSSCNNANCAVTEIGCADGYTVTSTTTATCPSTDTWSVVPTDICLQKCDVPTGWTVAADANSCCTGTSCTADCEVSQIGCDTGYTLKSGATATATCNAAGDGQWGAAVETICLKKCGVPTGATATTTTGSCCAATDTSCPAACVVTVFDCATGYTKQSGVVTAATCNAAGDGIWSAPAISGLCVKECEVPAGVTYTDAQSCCTTTGSTTYCEDNCALTSLGCATGYTILATSPPTDSTCGTATDGIWANVISTLCTKECKVPDGVTYTDSASCCTTTSGTTHCKDNCELTVLDCATGYTKQATNAPTGSVCGTTTDGTWVTDISGLCTAVTTTAATTTAATTTAASGAGDLSMTKSIILFVSSVMMLIF